MSLKIEVSIKCTDCTTSWERTLFPSNSYEAVNAVEDTYEVWQGMGWLRRGCLDYCPTHATVQKSEVAQ